MPFKESDFKKYNHFDVKSVGNGVIHVQVNRPKVLNSFSEETWTQYGLLIRHLNSLEDVRAIVYSGVGKHLSSGIDLKASSNMFKEFAGKPKETTLKFIKKFQEDINAGVGSKIPIIAVTHGISYGLTLDLISATSIRIASKDARFSIKEIDIGIIADIGSLQRLPLLSNNISKIYEYALTGDEFSAQDAHELGLVSNVYPTKDEALKQAFEVANKIARKYPTAVHGTKQNLDLVTTNSEAVVKGLDQVAVDNTNLMLNPKFAQVFAASAKKIISKL